MKRLTIFVVAIFVLTTGAFSAGVGYGPDYPDYSPWKDPKSAAGEILYGEYGIYTNFNRASLGTVCPGGKWGNGLDGSAILSAMRSHTFADGVTVTPVNVPEVRVILYRFLNRSLYDSLHDPDPQARRRARETTEMIASALHWAHYDHGEMRWEKIARQKAGMR